MYLKQTKTNGKTFLSLVHGYRVDGIVKQKTIEKFGYLEDLKKEYDDPIAHFKEVAKQRTIEYNQANDIKFTVSGNVKLESNTNNRKNLGYAVIKKIYNELEINTFMQKKQRTVDVEYNLNSIFSLLVFNRILFPSSKKKAYETKDVFFEHFDFSLKNIYRSLDYFYDYSFELQKHLNDQITTIFGRKKDLAYYDVTNFYFEIPYNDMDTIDEEGNIIPGFRKKGPSKENRKDPIVQMGLLMDNQGIPISFNTFAGNESEKTSLLPAIKKAKIDNQIDRIIVVADRGLNSSDNTYFLAGKNDDSDKHNDGYVFGQSVLGADKKFKEYVLKQEGYITDVENVEDDEGNIEEVIFKHKSRLFAKEVKIKKNDKRNVTTITYQKQMVYYSEKYAKKQKKQRELVLEKANDLIANPGKYTQATSYGAAKYINNLKFVKSTGEIANSSSLTIDVDKIMEEEKYDGYYSIVTSEKELTDKEIIDIYRGLWEIEESFKIIKSEFDARPMFVSTPVHINAHLLTCFVSLIIFRSLEIKLKNKFTTKQIRNALTSYSCSHICENYYLFDYRDKVIEEIEKVFNLDLSNKYMKRSQIKQLLQNN